MIRTHTAMPSPGGHHNVDPLDPAWRPAHPPVVPSARQQGPGAHLPPPGYGAARVPVERQRPPAAVPPSPPPCPLPAGPEHSDDGPSAGARRQADLRMQVAYRCKRANSSHLIAADEAFGRRDAVSPYAVMLFFTSDTPAEPHGYQLHTATRTWPQSPDSDDLPRLLADLTRVAADNIATLGPAWSPLGPDGCMVNGGDMTLPANATFVGVGVSTLDSDRGRWYQVAATLREAAAARRFMSAFNLKGQCYAALFDGTVMHIDRDPDARLGDTGIRCNKTLDPDRITYHNPHADRGDDETRLIWRQLTALNTILATHLLHGRPA